MKTNRIIKLSILITILQLLPFFAKTQVWSEPNIIFTGGNNGEISAVADNAGLLHIVWAHMIEDDYWKIYYSQSSDQGQTWTEPYSIAQNTEDMFRAPKIAVDSHNNLFVTYDKYTTTNDIIVYLQTYNRTQWSEPQLISEGYPNSYYSRLAVDKNDILYIFWFNPINGGKILYRTFYNNDFSSIEQLFAGQSLFFLDKAVFDSNNVLHCIADLRETGEYYASLIYFTKSNEQWSDYTIVNDRKRASCDLALNANNQPRVVWWRPLENRDTTLYSNMANNEWISPVGISGYSTEHALLVEKNDTEHLILMEKEGDIRKHIYISFSENTWSKTILQENTSGFYGNILIAKDTLMFLFYKFYNAQLQNEQCLVVRKMRIENQSSISHIENKTGFVRIYPNPFTDKTLIAISQLKSSVVKIAIFNLYGVLVYSSMFYNDSGGNCEFTWDGTSNKGNKLPQGIYLLQLVDGTESITSKLINAK